ncbi:hypothetical protein B1no1_10510 [Thermolongibacillus altinsuensis]|nr:hypothetical protein B1no1_10510 [Thermolongibacillus altinsuensis]
MMGRIGGNRRPLGGAVPDLEKVLEEFALGKVLMKIFEELQNIKKCE